MKYLTTLILLLLSTATFAQTSVPAKNYIKGSLVSARDTAIVVRAKGYVDYAINVPKAGTYSFVINTLNDIGVATIIHAKLPLGKGDLATVAIPVDPAYQGIAARVKLAAASKSIRFLFDDDVTISSFTYAPDVPIVGTISVQDFNDLKARVDSLEKRTIPLDRNVFNYLPDGKTVTIILPKPNSNAP